MSTDGRPADASVLPPLHTPRSSEAVSQPRPAPVAPARVIVAGLAAATGLLILADLAIKLFGRYVGPTPKSLNVINVGVETNAATWWNASLLLTVTALALTALFLTVTGAQVSRRSWLGVALAAGYLSLDEVAELHERLGRPMADWATSRDLWLPTYAWIFPGAALAAIGVVAAVRWSRTLPVDLRRGLLAAVGLYFAGALLVEAANGFARRRSYDLAHLIGTSVEELLEMAGCVLAIAVLIRAFVVRHIDGHRALFLRDDLQSARQGHPREAT